MATAAAVPTTASEMSRTIGELTIGDVVLVKRSLLIVAPRMNPVPPLLHGVCRRQKRRRRLIGGATINRKF
jgi:hypothetical protein